MGKLKMENKEWLENRLDQIEDKIDLLLEDDEPVTVDPYLYGKTGDW